jgi:DnaK suppressor protein
MLVALLQMMGIPMAKPVHSRAEGAGSLPASRAGETDTRIPDHRVSVRRQEVKATKASTSKASAGTTASAKTANTVKPAAKPSAVPAKAKAAPAAPAKAAPVKTAVATKKPAPSNKPAAPAAPAKKAPASAKATAKPLAVPAAKKPVAAKAPAAKAAPAKPSAKPTVAAKPAAPKKPAAVAVVLQTPSKETKAKAPAVVVEPKANPPVNAIPPKPAAPLSVPGVVSSVPTKSGRPSSRLAQLTVPSMAQSVASTAAKASFNPSSHEPFAAPVIPAIIKKDTKLTNNWKTTPVERLTDAELLAMPDSEYMNDVQLAAFKLKLSVLKRDILSNAGETTEHLREDTSVVPDPADRATIEEEHALELRTRDRERKLLKKIEQSITRIDAGDYGYCDETGEAIGVGRLLARPTATLSLEAQQRRELKQKMFGD